jgi:hypothetical protein
VKRSIVTLFVAATMAAATGPAHAFDATQLIISRQTITSLINIYAGTTVPWKCEHWNHVPCTNADLANGSLKQVLMFSAGFQDADRESFFDNFEHIIDSATGASAGSVWTVQRKSQLLFIAYYTGGGALGASDSSFGAQVMVHPIRGYGLTLRQDDVYAKINSMISSHEVPSLRPFVAGVLFNTQQNPVTSNASPPSFVDKPYGVAKFTLHDAQQSPYVVTHELAHAGLNYVDEYTEKGLENTNIKSFDVLTPLVQLDGTWGGFVDAISNFFGVYSVQISEVLANNGNDNVTTSRYPATVSTPGYSTPDYAYQSGMFFGLGTWHMPGANLMDDNNVTRGPDDGFAYAHSPAQQRVINQAFGDPGQTRPNDRLLNAGPVDGWSLEFGSTTHVMMRDADMYHHFQPTQSYAVQVGWYERNWHTCWAAFIPYPCYDSVWTTAQKSIPRGKRSINLKMSSAYGLASLLQNLLCEIGITEIPMSGGAKFQLCQNDLSTITDAFLPTMVFDIPYQDTDVPASQWLTTYWWRFSTNNGAIQSGWTGWSSFYRSL